MVPATDNGFIVPSVVNYGKKAYLRCNQGYKAEVSYTIRAIKLTWGELHYQGYKYKAELHYQRY